MMAVPSNQEDRSEFYDAYTNPSFSLRNRFARLLWHVANILFFRFSPRPCHAWRRVVLRLFGANIAKGCHIYPSVRIWAPWNLTCDEESGVADGVTLYNQAPITLGKRSVVSQGTHLCTGTHDHEDPGFPLVAKPIIVGELAWIAAECFIHPGVTIGEGAVIGARSVVTKDMPPWMVCAGHPCEPLKPRVIKGNAERGTRIAETDN